MEDENAREIAANASAQKFVLEILLSDLLRRIEQDGTSVDAFIARVLEVGSRTGHLRAENDAHAEILSDIAVRTQQAIAGIVNGARKRAGL